VQWSNFHEIGPCPDYLNNVHLIFFVRDTKHKDKGNSQ
jgi:hypothetical protein